MRAPKNEKTDESVQVPDGGFPFGRFDHALDPKKRLTIPALWRELLGRPSHFYVVRDAKNPCLMMLTPEEMRVRMEKLRQGPLTNQERALALRALGENSELVSVDANGRIRISDRLMAAAQLKSGVVFIGMGVKIEIWSAENRPDGETVFDGDALQSAYDKIGL